MAKRSYNRRSDDQLIADYEAKIRELEERMKTTERVDAPVIKELPKLKKQMARFSQLAMDHGRADLSNSILAFLTTFEVQAKSVDNIPSRGPAA